MKLSIITVVYNNLKGLIKTYDSLSNIHPSILYEWIVIDGGSSDGCVDFCESHNEKIACWISESDKGIYDAMNKGIHLASCDYLLFLNSGDEISSCFCQIDITNILDYDLIYGDAYFIEKGIKKIKTYPDTLTIDFFLRDSLCHQSVLFHKRLFKKKLYNIEYRIAADLDVITNSIITNRCSYKHIKIPICVYEGGGYSETHYYGIAKTERRSILSKFLDGGEYWYDAIMLRRELDNNVLFDQLKFLAYKKN